MEKKYIVKNDEQIYKLFKIFVEGGLTGEHRFIGLTSINFVVPLRSVFFYS